MTEKLLQNQEQEPQQRRTELILMRHGQATSQEKTAVLSELGKQQAREAAERLLSEILNQGGGILKIVKSPVKRAVETGNIVEQTIERLISERGVTNVRLLKSTATTRSPLRAPGLMPRLKKFNEQDPVGHWLKHPEILNDATPEIIVAELQKTISTMQAVNSKLNPNDHLFYVAVTHEIPQAALLNKVTGKNLDELGGGVKNCETVTITFTDDPKTATELSFRNEKVSI